MRFIGDVHGKFTQYKRLIADVPASIQVGDMGVGFRRISGYRDGEEYSNPTASTYGQWKPSLYTWQP